MWRWWIGAGLVVMALGVVGCGDNAHDVGPCADSGFLRDSWKSWVDTGTVDDEFYRELYRTYAPRLDVDVGETVKLNLAIRNKTAEAQKLTPEHTPFVTFSITWPDCEPLWFSTSRHAEPKTNLRFEPGEEREYPSLGEWNFQVEDFGDSAGPGWYLAHAIMGVYDEDAEERVGVMVAYRRFYVREKDLFGARDEYPPAPVDPSACGGPVWDVDDALRERDEHGDWLDVRNSPFTYTPAAPLLDGNRRSMHEYGIRVVVREYVAGGLELPECVGKLPVQVVVVGWSNRPRW